MRAANALLAPMAAAALVAAANAEIISHQVQIEGAGRPIVVFESGVGDTLDVWEGIQAHMSPGCARTFSYNRAGYLGSDVPPSMRDAAAIVAELREELRSRHLEPPYILVGHSLGGLYMQYFARNFPHEVSALLLIDSTHWRQGLKVDPIANTPYQARTAVTLFMPWIMRRELNDSAEAGREVNASPLPGALPTIVLSATKLSPGESSEQQTQAVALQDDIAAAYPGARHLFVENSGHYIQRDRPDAVIDAIEALSGCNHRKDPSGRELRTDKGSSKVLP
jgi:pimeloyl-ACP methyl ester carboxylesterase